MTVNHSSLRPTPAPLASFHRDCEHPMGNISEYSTKIKIFYPIMVGLTFYSKSDRLPPCRSIRQWWRSPSLLKILFSFPLKLGFEYWGSFVGEGLLRVAVLPLCLLSRRPFGEHSRERKERDFEGTHLLKRTTNIANRIFIDEFHFFNPRERQEKLEREPCRISLGSPYIMFECHEICFQGYQTSLKAWLKLHRFSCTLLVFIQALIKDARVMLNLPQYI